jgi:hypothetical protein
MMNISKHLSDLSFRRLADGIGTLSRLRGTGCQGFTGPLPSAFLDKQVKEQVQRYIGASNCKNIFSG